MTVCIAAVCEGGKQLVVGADQMVTISAPLNVEFDPPLSKIESMGTSSVALGAGNTLYVAEILRQARDEYQNVQSPVPQIADAVCKVYKRYRDEKAEELVILPPLGLDFLNFRLRGGTLPAYLQPQPGIYQQLTVMASRWNLGVDIIVAGIDQNGSHMYWVGNPGTSVCFDKIGYNAVGTGATHVAIKLALELQHPNSSLAETMLSVYGAKKASEVAPGVGQETEIKVVSQEGIWLVRNELMEIIRSSNADEQSKSKPNIQAIKEKYDELRKTSGSDSGGN